jgi:ABC-type transporter Mla MlaB component
MSEYKLGSSLLINNVHQLLNQFSRKIMPGKLLRIDLADVCNIDSAGLAFLVELKVCARKKNSTIEFINLSEPVTRFCQLYQLTL